MPKVSRVHYIWMGGPIPDAYVPNIFHILANSRHDIRLWTDRPERNREVFDRVLGRDVRSFGRMHFVDIKAFQDRCEEWKELAFLSPSQRQVLKEAFRFEHRFYAERNLPEADLAIVTRLGNYATLSDIFRLLILYLEGGVYIDCDNSFASQETAGLRKPVDCRQFDMELQASHALHSDRDRFSNAVLASAAKAEGTRRLLLRTLDTIHDLKTGRQRLDGIGQLANMGFFKEDGVLHRAVRRWTRMPLLRSDLDLKRFGKLPHSVKQLMEMDELTEPSIRTAYPYFGISLVIGPLQVHFFELDEPGFHRVFPPGSLIDNMVQGSGMNWL